jgi:uncharacterized membrane protein YedE/YeeE
VSAATSDQERAQLASALVAGLVFGAGLVVSGMVLPEKVVRFLDFTNGWDPSLALVMVGAIAVHATAYRLVMKRPSPLFAAKFSLPTHHDLDARLLGGAALFGLGWGFGGICPGPGLAATTALATDALVFVAAMGVGMFAVARLDRANPGLGSLAPTPASMPASTHSSAELGATEENPTCVG